MYRFKEVQHGFSANFEVKLVFSILNRYQQFFTHKKVEKS